MFGPSRPALDQIRNLPLEIIAGHIFHLGASSNTTPVFGKAPEIIAFAPVSEINGEGCTIVGFLGPLLKPSGTG
jgi:hypothetical protein